MLVERDAPLATLTSAVDAVRAGGAGRLVLVAGEAGAGKTFLLKEFVRSLPAGVGVRWGACDNLRVARPLGPIVELEGDGGQGIVAAGADREGLLRAAAGVFERSGPAFMVVEDVHWADEATLDVLSFAGRRLALTRTVLVLTYRADELGPRHPLVAVLGDLATTSPLRVAVLPLSLDGVAILAAEVGAEVNVSELHRRTGGNAFFVTESLSSGLNGVPDSVREAVLARVGRRGDEARRAIEAAAIVPGRAELWLLDALGVVGSAIDEAVHAGLLVAVDGGVVFRHELARMAVLGSLPPGRSRDLHRLAASVLACPPSGRADHARVVHHADAAGDADMVVHHGPLAADSAVAVGARREAIGHLERVVAYADRVDPRSRLEFISRLAGELALVGRHDEAIVAYQGAIALAVQLGNSELHGELLARLGPPLTMAGRTGEGAAAARQAVSLLEGIGPSRPLARAFAQVCTDHMLARELLPAAEWGRRAIDLAERLDDHETLAYALIQSGIAAWMGGDEEGLAVIRRGIEIARRHGLDAQVTHGLSQIGSGGGEIRRYGEAVPALVEATEVADRLELASRGLYASAWLGRCALEQGRWTEAATILDRVTRSPRCEGITRMTALTALGRLRARRGDPGAAAPLDEALSLARHTGHLQRLWPVAAGRAEAAWLTGELPTELPLLHDVFALARELAYPWATGEIGFWLWRAGELDSLPAGSPSAFAFHVAGDAAAAAAEWCRMGCPYDEAVALADTHSEEHLRRALHALQGLGARPAAAMVAAKLRDAGARSVPRGPRPTTRTNVAGLTVREQEVLCLVVDGRHNRDIATRLFISERTVDRHVATILRKLGVASRGDAAVQAVRRGLVSKDG